MAAAAAALAAPAVLGQARGRIIVVGGGFGGAIVALVAMSSIEKVAEAVEAAYCEKTGHNGKAYRCLIGDGALVQT